jgi:serine protease Do
MKNNNFNWTRASAMMLVVVASIVGGIILSSRLGMTPLTNSEPFWKESDKGPENPPAKEGKNGVIPSFSGIVKQVRPAVVNIFTTKVIKQRGYGFPFEEFEQFFGPQFRRQFPERKFKQSSLGSGFIITEDGYILTNNHVVEGMDEIKVKLTDDEEFTAKVIGRDPKIDVALIKIDAKKKLPVVVLGDSDALEIGDWVVAIGNPFGLGHTVTAGIVSAKGRHGIIQGSYEDFIQTDAAINPGNSGGPLINLNGEVIGINSAIFSPQGAFGTPGNIGIGFAIPINMAKSVLTQLKETGKVVRGWLGVMIQPITPEIAEALNLEKQKGALIADVTPGSPAEKAGLQRGDIIIEFDGKKIDDYHNLPPIVAGTPVGKRAKVKIIREGKTKELTIDVAEMPPDVSGEVTTEETASDEIGISVSDITNELAQRYDIREKEGVVVTDVTAGSMADMAGIQPGDLIVEVNKKQVRNTKDFNKEIIKVGKGKSVLFLIKRGNSTIYVALRKGG